MSPRLRFIRQRLIEAAIIATMYAGLACMVCGLPFVRHQPDEGTTTIDQLVAHLPKTRKFAAVSKGGKVYVVWIGKVRGAMESGPPVYVFDSAGNLVDAVGDAGDSHNAFVGELYGEAFRSPAMTPSEAVAFCHRRRAK